jgi:hypothetical protein
MTEKEKKLLRQQAEAYAFIHDLRRVAITLGDRRYILLTEGIDKRIEKRKQEYPSLFQRYFNQALRRAEDTRVETVIKHNQPVEENGERESVQKREEEKKKERAAASSGREGKSLETVGKAPLQKKKKRIREPSAGAKRGPE